MALATVAVSGDATPTAEKLHKKIVEVRAQIGVVGLGYVGLPMAHALHQGGHPVLGFDTDPRKVEALEHGNSYLKHLGPEMAKTLAASQRFSATADFARLPECDAIIVCVPTPLGPHREPDLSFVLETARAIGSALRPGQLICLESTTYPGTTRDHFLPAMLEASRQQLELGRDLFVAFSPEREDPGSANHSTHTIPKLVGGLDSRSTELASALYANAVRQVVSVDSAEVAEAAKLLENIFRAVNIALVNEMKVILSEMDINVWDVIRAASTKPFGYMPFFPGPGLGGHCIPIDPFYLTWKAKELGRPTKFIELAGEVNTEMPGWVVGRVGLGLNNYGKAVRGSRVLVLGLAYKPNIDDCRESPAFELIDRLSDLGADVAYSDPHIPVAPKVRRHDTGLTSVEITAESISEFDCVLIATNHDEFDWGLIARHANLVVDTRDAMREFSGLMGDRLIRA